jgi:DNA-binding GntR family transcriptional regulator
MGKKEQPEWALDLPVIDSSTKIPLSQRVYASVLMAISKGTIRPGEHLVEQTLADALGASRIPIREAIRKLALTGLVEIVPGQGAFVVNPDRKDIEEIFSFRALLEGEAARLATQRSLTSDLMRLEEIICEMEAIDHAGDRLAAASIDLRFHRTLVENARHKRLLAGWETMESLIMMLVYDSSAGYPNIHGLPDRHRVILAPMKAGDFQAAEAAVRHHILSAGEQLCRSVEGN